MSDELANDTMNFIARDVPHTLSFIFKEKPTQTQIAHSMEVCGKQSMKSLMQKSHNQKLADVEITTTKIKGFDKIAKRYAVDYAVLRDKTQPNRWMVYFKAKDVDLITAAFKEHTAARLKANKIEKPSILDQIKNIRKDIAKKPPALNQIKDIKKDIAKVAKNVVQKKVDISR